jgi:hypothetical protein
VLNPTTVSEEWSGEQDGAVGKVQVLVMLLAGCGCCLVVVQRGEQRIK